MLYPSTGNAVGANKTFCALNKFYSDREVIHVTRTALQLKSTSRVAAERGN